MQFCRYYYHKCSIISQHSLRYRFVIFQLWRHIQYGSETTLKGASEALHSSIGGLLLLSLPWNRLTVWGNTVHLWKGSNAVPRWMTAALGGLASFILATATVWEAGKQKPGWRMRAQTFFFLSEMSSYVPMPGRRRPPARCDKPQDHSPHCTENAVGGLPKLMGLMTVIALSNLSFSLPCTFSPCGALYTYLQVHIWNAPASQAWFR